MTPDSLLAEARALIDLEKTATPGPWGVDPGLHSSDKVMLSHEDARFACALRNWVGSGKLLALVERVEVLDDRIVVLNIEEREAYLFNLKGRIELLEAERDIWKNRAQHGRYEIGGPFPDPTPAEIAARVEQNRKKERTR